MYKVYLDNCCNSRLFDNNTQPKVMAQAAAIRRIINNRASGGYKIVGSFAVDAEIGKNPDVEMRREAEKLYKSYICGRVELSANIHNRAVELTLIMGLDDMDASHLAAAEAAGAAFLLTTDERFIHRCKRKNITAVKVIDPLDF